MTGTLEDPEDHTAVAATVFSAVIVYAVRLPPPFSPYPPYGTLDTFRILGRRPR